eukprot:TRINITY_DN2869_c0_g1_i1.p1 TRINITY_DN2869_c0_g1~~TRINITY_DN2869_c0_g1_i1.p1  ORF type:complete len:520 (+),score=210.78 TRINITY_DN2869_c0_g1_i1:124-1683(+)
MTSTMFAKPATRPTIRLATTSTGIPPVKSSKIHDENAGKSYSISSSNTTATTRTALAPLGTNALGAQRITRSTSSSLSASNSIANSQPVATQQVRKPLGQISNENSSVSTSSSSFGGAKRVAINVAGKPTVSSTASSTSIAPALRSNATSNISALPAQRKPTVGFQVSAAVPVKNTAVQYYQQIDEELEDEDDDDMEEDNPDSSTDSIVEMDAMEIEIDDIGSAHSSSKISHHADKPKKALKGVIDIDCGDVEDPLFCVEYVDNIFAHFREKEESTRVDFGYMDKQVDITRKHRMIMVDWMAEVIVKFNLLSETMFLAVNILDRFLQIKAVARNKLQLVGTACMLIASKFEEIFTPKVDDFIYITANAYPREELLKMEKLVLLTLNFNLNVPAPIHFLRRFSKAAHSDAQIHTLSKYLIELSMLEYSMIEFSASQIAAASVFISRAMASKNPNMEDIGTIWTSTLEHYTGFSASELMPCIQTLNGLLQKQGPAFPYKSFYRKFSSPKLYSVAAIPTVNI